MARLPSNCSRCGAPLTPEVSQTLVCRFCQARIQPLEEPPLPLPGADPQKLAAMAQIMSMAVRAQEMRAAMPPRRRSSVGCFVTLVIIVLIVCGSCVALVMLRDVAPQPPPPARPAPVSPSPRRP